MNTVADLISKSTIYLGPECTLIDAIDIMRQNRIGALLIKEKEEVVGIFTERDLLTKVDLSAPASLEKLKLKDVMTTELKTVDFNESYTNVIDLMRTQKIRHAPVMQDGRVIGVVSLRDLGTHYEETLHQMLEQKEKSLINTLNKHKESEERFRTVFENSAVGIMLADKDERIIAWNSFIESLLEMRQEDLLNKPVKELYLDEEWQRIRSFHIRKRGMKHHLETQIRNKREELIDVDISISVLKDAGGEITGSIGIIRDIRERKQVEDELNRYREHLEELVEKRTEELKGANTKLIQEINERKKVEVELQVAYNELKDAQNQLVQAEKMQVVGGLATGVAHEVKNPLMIIQQGVAYLTKRFKSEDNDIATALTHIESAIKRADQIVLGLLDFARTTSLDVRQMDVAAVMDEALAFIKHHLTQGQVEVIREYQDNRPTIDLDKPKMEQVFIDLILNSLSAMPQGGTITVKIYKQKLDERIGPIDLHHGVEFKKGEEVVLVELLDTGEGIPEDVVGKIFDPFFTTKRATGGTGLGLPVVKNIITMHDGRISVANREGTRGAKVTIMLKLRLPKLRNHGQD